MNTASWFGANRILNVLLLSWLASSGSLVGDTQLCCFGVFCITIPGGESGSSEGLGFGEVGVTIIDMTFKGLPIVADPDDTDPKDTKVSKAKLDGQAFGNGKRLLMRAKRDGAAHRMFYNREFSGDFTSGILISVDPDVGSLVDGQSAGFYEVREKADAGAEGAPLFMRMTATWDADNQGLRVSAEDQGGPLGDPVVFPGSTEVVLAMNWNEGGRFLNAGPLDTYEEGFGDFSFTDVVPVPTGIPFLMGFGVEKLGKAARFYFINLAIRSASLGSGGGEVAAAMYATVALSFIEQAWSYALEGFDPNFVKYRLDTGLMYLDMAKQELEDATEAGNVHESAQVKLARRSLKKGMKRLTKGGKLADKLVKKDKPPTNSLAHRCNQARWEALLIQAQLFGFKSKSIDRYFNTLIVDVPSFGGF